MSVVLPADALRRFAAGVFAHHGLAQAHAAIVADTLVWASLRGTDSHGIVRLGQYLRHIKDGDMNPQAAPRIVIDAGAAVLIDADRAAGPVGMTEARKAALRKARTHGVGLALMRRATHTAALGYYTSSAASEGFAALAMSGCVPQMAYHGARGAAVSTSPISIAVPGGRFPIVFDMATSVVGLGRLLQRGKAGLPIPQGWATDAEGKPSTDPAKAVIPLPMAEHKGSGLSLMIEMLTGVLGGNPLIAAALLEGQNRHSQNALLLAIDVAKFIDPAVFRREAARVVQAIKSLEPSEGHAEVRIPGERGERTFEERSRSGIPVPEPLYQELKRIGERSGVEVPTA